jgi:hypothetical protein
MNLPPTGPAARSAALAAAVVVVLAAGCGAARPTATYDNDRYAFSFAYDGSRFQPGRLADAALIDAVHRAGDVTPLFSVSYVSAPRPPTAAASPDGFRVSVFDFPPEARSFGLWRLGDQVVPPLMAKVRQALPPGSTVGDPERVEFLGMQGYATSYSVPAGDQTYTGWVAGWARGDYVYELLLQGTTAGFAALRPAFEDVLFHFRAGAGPRADVP